MSSRNQEDILKTFRQQLEEEEILHDGDTIGTDDETLLYVLALFVHNELYSTLIQAILTGSKV